MGFLGSNPSFGKKAYFLIAYSLIFLFLLLIIVIYNWSQNSNYGLKFHEYQLENGLKIVIIPIHKAPVVSHVVWYDVGAANEPVGKSGVAHLLEHMMFKGTKNLGPSEFSKRIAELGGHDNAFTTPDFTAYYQIVPKAYLSEVMKLEADRMQNLLMDETEIKRERDVVLEERRSRVDNKPLAQMIEKMKVQLFGKHPYATPTIGWYDEIATLEKEDLLSIYKKYYAPNNASVIVLGDVEIEPTLELIEEHYGAIQSSDLTTPMPMNDFSQIDETSITHCDEKVTQARWVRYQLAPSITGQKDYDHIHALMLASFILGESSSSKLYNELVINQRIAAQIGTSYDPLMLGPAIFVTYAVPTESSLDPVTLEAAIDKQIEAIAKGAFSDAELQQAKTTLIAENIYAQEDFTHLAFAIGRMHALGFDLAAFSEFDEAIEAIGRGDVMRAAQRLLSNKNRITGHLIPGKPGC